MSALADRIRQVCEDPAGAVLEVHPFTAAVLAVVDQHIAPGPNRFGMCRGGCQNQTYGECAPLQAIGAVFGIESGTEVLR